MAVYLLDTSVIINAINGKRDRPNFLQSILSQGHLLACCPINVTEIYAGMRSHEAQVTEAFLGSLRFYDVTWDIARLAGQLKNAWAKKGNTLFLPDVTIAAVAITHNLILLTENRKDFPMPEIHFQDLP
jgi:predicted nucleic acid-binding protein